MPSKQATPAHQEITDLDFFARLEGVVDAIWDQVVTWDWFAKRVVGVQLMTSLDSIGANLVEGDGRYGEADVVKFFRYSRSSLKEAQLWLRCAVKRKLVSASDGAKWAKSLYEISKVISKLIKYRQDFGRQGTVREQRATYGKDDPALRPATHDLRPDIERAMGRAITITEDME